MTVGRICVRDVDLAEAGESVQAAALRMNTRKVGTLIVQGDVQQPVGILTDRDLAIRVVGRGLDPITTTVDQVMTRSPATVREDSPLEAAISLMRAGPYRRLPVVSDTGKLVGLLSLDDVVDLLASEMAEIGELIEQEGPGSLG